MKMSNSFMAAAALALAASVGSQSASAAIAQGSMMVTAVNTDAGGVTDGFAIVALANIAAGEVIYVTDNELTTTGATSFNTGESFSKWTIGARGIAAGSVIRISGFDTLPIVVSDGAGTMSALSFPLSTNRGLSNGADSLYFYQAASDATADVPVTHLCYMNIGNIVDGQISSSLNSVFTTSILSGSNSAQYTGPRNNQATLGDYAALINNTANWTGVAGGTNPTTFDATPFTTIPTPGSLALVGAGVLVAARRRRN